MPFLRVLLASWIVAASALAVWSGCTSYAAEEETPNLSEAGGDVIVSPPNDNDAAGNDANAFCNADLNTSADHCGRCNHSCLGATCTAGRCDAITLAASQTAPDQEMQIAVRNDTVYWRAGPESNRVYRLPITGNTQPAIVTTCASNRGLAVDDTHVFTHCSCDLQSTTLDGGVKRNGQTLCNHIDLTIDNDAVYVASKINIHRQRPKGELVNQMYPKLVPDFGYNNGAIHALAAHGGFVYHSYVDENPTRGVIGFVSTAGAATFSVFAPNENEPRGLVVDDNGAAWISIGTVNDAGVAIGEGEVRVQKLVAGTAATVGKGALEPFAIAVDVDHVYFARARRPGEEAGLFRARRDGGGGAVETLVSGEPTIQGIAVDANAVYYVTRGVMAGQGTVKKVAKP